MSVWPTVALKDCVRVVGGATPKSGEAAYWDGNIPWTTPKDLSDMDGKYLRDTPRKITAAGLKSCSSELLPANSVLFSSRAPIGHVAINTIPVATNQGFKSMIPGPRIDATFLYWWLKCNRAKLELLGNGATFKEVSKSIVERVGIPLPPLDEQKRIAAILDQADELRRKRQRAIDRLNQLSQAIFHELFGDPVSNDRGWPVRRLDDVSHNITDGTHDTPARIPSGIPFITSKNVRPYEFDMTNLEYVSLETHREIIKRCNPRRGDVLYTNIGASVGSAVQNRFDFEFSLKNVALIQPNQKELLPDFLEFMLNNPRFKESLLSASAAGGAQKFITLKALRSASVPIPTIGTQEIFAKRIAEVSTSKEHMSHQLRSISSLFSSLQIRAFQGEL